MLISRRRRLLLAALGSAGLLPWAASARAQAAADAPAHVRAALAGARLAGEGRFRYFGFNVYDAQLWVGALGFIADAETAGRTPFALRLTYRRDFTGAHIARTSREEMQRLGHGTPARLQDWERSMAGLFPDVRVGEHLTGVYLPPSTARFYHNEQLVGEVRDTAFARAFFAIWFDPATRARELRAKMLSGASPAGAP